MSKVCSSLAALTTFICPTLYGSAAGARQCQAERRRLRAGPLQPLVGRHVAILQPLGPTSLNKLQKGRRLLDKVLKTYVTERPSIVAISRSRSEGR